MTAAAREPRTCTRCGEEFTPAKRYTVAPPTECPNCARRRFVRTGRRSSDLVPVLVCAMCGSPRGVVETRGGARCRRCVERLPMGLR